ncbi:MAG: clan AA aspartic protease [Chloroflexota bacterium]|nr:clan AA aspartic protease [Chloroflexota bacterium]
MIRGAVDNFGQASVPLEIRYGDGEFHSLRVVVDTGFHGHLTLYPEIIGQLGLRPMRSLDVALAGNLRRTVNTYRGQVLWHGQLKTIRILEASGAPLLGMRLLSGSQLTIQAMEGGQVLIEEL